MNHRTCLATPIGPLALTVENDALVRIAFETTESADEHSVLREARAQLKAYFAGELQTFELPLAPVGTLFQQEVWRALQAIPYGGRCAYADIARAIGKPNATRAVGGANNRNPLAIVVPCHRVIGRDGSLTGYGGGLDRKEYLLSLETREARSPSKRQNSPRVPTRGV